MEQSPFLEPWKNITFSPTVGCNFRTHHSLIILIILYNSSQRCKFFLLCVTLPRRMALRCSRRRVQRINHVDSASKIIFISLCPVHCRRSPKDTFCIDDTFSYFRVGSPFGTRPKYEEPRAMRIRHVPSCFVQSWSVALRICSNYNPIRFPKCPF